MVIDVRVTLSVNDDRRELDLEPRQSLGDALTSVYGATGVDLRCTDGTCGACTVLVDGEVTQSCLLLAVQCDGAHVRTVEGPAVDRPGGDRS
ncbi:2Fe-2S cluster binding protein [Actinoplanes friuliensis DSM 7358]|uniref:2Fe-2S cluster binding protein n=1 Tax=Actinoplanes friuliensis DSM 7358 TaxID=1246995 RepID=U5VZU2_9ACTN|nr:2Fe-2S cluster binding protein [Actinoplanes friuliensis DSM 7358]